MADQVAKKMTLADDSKGSVNSWDSPCPHGDILKIELTVDEGFIVEDLRRGGKFVFERRSIKDLIQFISEYIADIERDFAE